MLFPLFISCGFNCFLAILPPIAKLFNLFYFYQRLQLRSTDQERNIFIKPVRFIIYKKNNSIRLLVEVIMKREKISVCILLLFTFIACVASAEEGNDHSMKE